MATTAFDYTTESREVKAALRRALGENAAIETSEGWKGRVHVKVVSPLFNGKNEREKQAFIWEILKDELKEKSQSVTLALAYGMEDI